jgi:hypothetical protein
MQTFISNSTQYYAHLTKYREKYVMAKIEIYAPPPESIPVFQPISGLSVSTFHAVHDVSNSEIGLLAFLV